MTNEYLVLSAESVAINLSLMPGYNPNVPNGARAVSARQVVTGPVAGRPYCHRHKASMMTVGKNPTGRIVRCVEKGCDSGCFVMLLTDFLNQIISRNQFLEVTRDNLITIVQTQHEKLMAQEE